MVKALFDTNLLIDYLRGIDAAREELGRYAEPAISDITWMEVMVGVTSDTEKGTRAFLMRFKRLPLDTKVCEAAVSLRRTHRMRLPDAIILASARTHGLMLVTRNTRDFPPEWPGIRVPYELPVAGAPSK